MKQISLRVFRTVRGATRFIGVFFMFYGVVCFSLAMCVIFDPTKYENPMDAEVVEAISMVNHLATAIAFMGIFAVFMINGGNLFRAPRRQDDQNNAAVS